MLDETVYDIINYQDNVVLSLKRGVQVVSFNSRKENSCNKKAQSIISDKNSGCMYGAEALNPPLGMWLMLIIL